MTILVSLERLLKIIVIMKQLFTLISVTMLTFGAVAQTAAVSTNGQSTAKEAAKPAVEAPAEESLVLKEREFNFGKIPQGKPVMHIFEVIPLLCFPYNIHAFLY